MLFNFKTKVARRTSMEVVYLNQSIYEFHRHNKFFYLQMFYKMSIHVLCFCLFRVPIIGLL